MTTTREFNVTHFDLNTLRSTVIAQLQIEGTDAEDCWRQAEKWRDDNAGDRGDTVYGVFLDLTLLPTSRLKRS